MAKNTDKKKKVTVNVLSVEDVKLTQNVFEQIDSTYGVFKDHAEAMLTKYGLDKTKAENTRSHLYQIAREGGWAISESRLKHLCSEWMKENNFNSREREPEAESMELAQSLKKETEKQIDENEGMPLADAVAKGIAMTVYLSLLALFEKNEKQKWLKLTVGFFRKLYRNKSFLAQIEQLLKTAGAEPEKSDEATIAEIVKADSDKRVDDELAKIEAAQDAGTSKPRGKRASRKTAAAKA
tara:strand:+ start:6722 stop:7438 length:717 start_codon:yes stop_codon:yes gene_type:complete